MRWAHTKPIAILATVLLLAGSAACMRAEPVSVQETAAPLTQKAASKRTPAAGAAPTPMETPIPASAFMESYFRRAGDAPEKIVRDDEHGHWEYRADALDVRIDCVTTDLGRGSVTYFVVHIRTRNGEAARGISAEDGALPWRLARENRAVLLLSGDIASLSDDGMRLVADGEVVADLAHLPGRGVDARAAVGDVSEGHAVAVVSDGRQPGYSVGLSYAELADVLVEHGAWDAYALADGRATALVFMGEQINHHAGIYTGTDPSYQARVQRAIAFGESALTPDVTETFKNDGNA